MPRDEKPRSQAFHLPSGIGRIAPRMAADMYHQHRQCLAGPVEYLGEPPAQFSPVDVAVHGTQGTECRQSVRHRGISDISRMPDFVAGSQMREDGLVDVSVRVRYETYPCQWLRLSTYLDCLMAMVRLTGPLLTVTEAALKRTISALGKGGQVMERDVPALPDLGVTVR